MVRISVELPDELAEQLMRAATVMDAPPERLMEQATRALLDDREALRQSVARGLADAEAGRTVAHEDVMAELEAWAAALEEKHRSRA